MADDGASEGASTVLDKLCAYLETVPGTNQLWMGSQWHACCFGMFWCYLVFLYALCIQPRLHLAKTWETIWMRFFKIGPRWRELPGLGRLCFLWVCDFPSGARHLVVKKHLDLIQGFGCLCDIPSRSRPWEKECAVSCACHFVVGVLATTWILWLLWEVKEWVSLGCSCLWFCVFMKLSFCDVIMFFLMGCLCMLDVWGRVTIIYHNIFSGNVQCWLALSDFPNNSQLCMYFREFAQFGYKSSAEAVVTKFPYCDGSRCLEQFSVGVSDGFTKVLLMFLIISFVEELELSKEEQETLKSTLCSFKYVRCTYEHFDNPGHHYLNSLSFLAMFLLREGGMCFSQLIH
jgi:hypothetical protein